MSTPVLGGPLDTPVQGCSSSSKRRIAEKPEHAHRKRLPFLWLFTANNPVDMMNRCKPSTSKVDSRRTCLPRSGHEQVPLICRRSDCSPARRWPKCTLWGPCVLVRGPRSRTNIEPGTEEFVPIHQRAPLLFAGSSTGTGQTQPASQKYSSLPKCANPWGQSQTCSVDGACA